MTTFKIFIAAFILIAGAGFFLAGSPSPVISSQGPQVPAVDPVLHMPPDVAAFVARSCGDCHTDQPHLPWYAKVPPASWLVEHDMADAHRSVNFTQWTQTNGKSFGSAVGTLNAACTDMQSERMPLKEYVWMHPGAKPRPDEVAHFCDWTRMEVKRLVAAKRHPQSLAGN